ncbi:MAG: FHA domain-containing protein [Actinomycetia bacterium]|nr:FHA domain-containing protein [Actinomycetes bacterium]
MRSFDYVPGPSALVAAWPVALLLGCGVEDPVVARVYAALGEVVDLTAALAIIDELPGPRRLPLAAMQATTDGARVAVGFGGSARLGDAWVESTPGLSYHAAAPGEAVLLRVSPFEVPPPGGGTPEPDAAEPLGAADAPARGTVPLRWGVAGAVSVALSASRSPVDLGPGVAFAPVVPARLCPREHPNPPEVTRCRACGRAVSSPIVSIARPMLGTLRLSSGAHIPLDRGVVFGRHPGVPAGTIGQAPNLVRITDPDKDISGQHLEVRLDGWQVLVIDLGSTNGTEVFPPHARPAGLEPGEPTEITPGTRVVLANAFDFVYEL